VLLECESTSRFFDLDTAFSDLLETSLEEGVALTGIVAASVAQRREMWAFREGIPAAMMSTKLPMVRTDTAVPIDAVPGFLGRVVGGLLALFPEGIGLCATSTTCCRTFRCIEAVDHHFRLNARRRD
jgi:FAD/FMN-containing dehydrogenase